MGRTRRDLRTEALDFDSRQVPYKLLTSLVLQAAPLNIYDRELKETSLQKSKLQLYHSILNVRFLPGTSSIIRDLCWIAAIVARSDIKAPSMPDILESSKVLRHSEWTNVLARWKNVN